MNISNRNKRTATRPPFAGIKGSDCQVVPGGLAKNAAHFENLLLSAGMKQSEIDALCDSRKGIIFRATTLRAELHTRGILPLPGRSSGSAPVAAGDDLQVPPELAQAISQIATRIESLSATLPQAAGGPAAIEALRAEIKSMDNNHSQAAAKRRGEIMATIRQIEAGTHNAAAPQRAAQLFNELAALSGLMDKASVVRKASICAELRALRAA